MAGGGKSLCNLRAKLRRSGENCVLTRRTPPIRSILSEIVGASAWPGQRHWNNGINLRVWRAALASGGLHRLFTSARGARHGLRVATRWPLARPSPPQWVDATGNIAKATGSNGLSNKDSRPEDERADIDAAKACTRSHPDQHAAGHTGRCSENTGALDRGEEWQFRLLVGTPTPMNLALLGANRRR